MYKIDVYETDTESMDAEVAKLAEQRRHGLVWETEDGWDLVDPFEPKDV